jgi:hypothetical protein
MRATINDAMIPVAAPAAKTKAMPEGLWSISSVTMASAMVKMPSPSEEPSAPTRAVRSRERLAPETYQQI